MDEFIIVIITFVLNFLPIIICLERGGKNIVTVLLLNIFLSWTIIGWLVALYLALKKEKKTNSLLLTDNENFSEKYSNIEKLHSLYERNIISEEEFNIQKKKLL